MSSDTKAAGPPSGQTVLAQRPTINVGVGMTVSAVVTVLVVMGELSRLSGEILDQAGRSWAFGTLMGPGRLLDPFTDGWSSVFPNHVEDRAWWLIAYVLLDFVFIWLYGSVIARWLEESWPSLSLLSTLLRWLAAVDVAEDVLAVFVRIVRNIGWRIAALAKSDATVGAREIAHLRLPRAEVAGIFMNEDDGRALAGFLVIKLGAVARRDMGHQTLQ